MENKSNDKENKVTYIAELDADVDDVVAAEYLHNKGVLKEVILDPFPTTEVGKERMNQLLKLGITISKQLHGKQQYVFCGGALTEVARFIKTNHIDVLVMNGGFVGSNIVPLTKQLNKFQHKEKVRTFNFNCDIKSTDYVLKSTERQIGKIYLIGKNVCHSIKNTQEGIWTDKEYTNLFDKYHVRPDKRQHDMLACHEGLAMLGLGNVKTPYCTFLEVKPCNNGLKGKMTEWGSTTDKSIYRKVISAITFIE